MPKVANTNVLYILTTRTCLVNCFLFFFFSSYQHWVPSFNSCEETRQKVALEVTAEKFSSTFILLFFNVSYYRYSLNLGQLGF